MSTLTVHRTVAAPLERVWTVATDLRGAAETFSGIVRVEVLTDGPVGVGTSWRETRRMFGREGTETLTITEFEPPHRYVVTARSAGADYESVILCSPQGDDATEVTMTFRGTATNPVAAIMALLTAPLGTAATRNALRQDLEDLARACEQGR